MDNDEVIGTEILSDKTILVAGKFSNLPAAANTYNPLGISTPTHQILLFSPDGQTLTTIVEMDEMFDLDIDAATDAIVIHREDFVTKLSNDGQNEFWSSGVPTATGNAIYSRGKRLDVGNDGSIAILGNENTGGNEFDGLIRILDVSGATVTNFSIPNADIGGGTYNETWEDIAYDSDNGLVFVTGKAQRCNDYQSAFLMAYNIGMITQVWKNFTLWCSAASNLNLGADCRGKRVTFKNGNLYFIGNADGGNNRFTREEADETTVANHNVTIDNWNNGAGFGSGKITYFAKLDPLTGTAENGQFQFSSTGVNQAKSFEALTITEDDQGNVLLGGSSHKDLPDRSNLTLNNTLVGPRVDNETALISVSSNFTNRNTVATFTGTSGAEGTIIDIASRDGLYALVGTTEGALQTMNALDNTHNGTEGFLVVYGDPLVGITEIDGTGQTLDIYPNPAENIVRIRASSPLSLISIVDIQGRLLIEKDISSLETTINVSHLPKGTYLLKSRDGRTAKFLK